MKKTIIIALAFILLGNLKAQQTPEIKDVALFLHENVEILDFAGPMEVFIAAGFNVYTVAETKEPLKAMRKLTVIPDYSIEDCPTPDLIAFFGGGGAARVAQREPVKKWMAEIFPKTDLQFSVCTGAFFLGEMGLLDGKTATTFHSAIPGLQKQFPEATVRDDVRFVDNGTVITTAGISAGIDGALHLVAKIKGKDQALRVAENMEYFGWEPEKGLVLPSPFIKDIQEHGLANALQAADKNTIVFPGELMDLGNELATAGDQRQALDIYEYALENFIVSDSDCESIRKTLVALGKSAPPSRAEVLELIEAGKYAQVAQLIKSTKKEYANWAFFQEWKANVYGYQLLGKDKIEDAIEVFKLNVLAYPASFNTYDSLGEAYLMAEDWDLAIQNYERSIQLNPLNDNGRKMLEKIEKLRHKGKRME